MSNPTNTPPQTAYLDLRGLAHYSSLSIRTIRRILQNPGGPPYIRLRGKLLVRRESWDQWLDSHKDQAESLDDIVNAALASLQ
jgi:hypothetical protein